MRLKWVANTYDKWTTETGETLDLNVDIPYRIMVKVREAVDKWLWNNCTIAKKYKCENWDDL